MAIKIGNLTRERREGKASLTFEENGEIKTEEIRISFLKPTEALWREVSAMDEVEGAEEKNTRVAQLLKLDLQSPDITNDDGTVHQLTESDLQALDAAQVIQLWLGVQEHFFLRTPESKTETNTNSSSAQASAA
jgi:hypothetical protein